jgi:hypothetical protein
MITTSGCLFKIMHWPGAAIVLVTGITMLALLFIPLAIKSCIKTETDKKTRIFYLLTAIVAAVNLLGAMFKINHWPGSSLLLIIGIPLPFVVLLPVYLLSNRDDKGINYKNFTAVMFFFAYFAAITALLALGISRNVLNSYIKSANSIEANTAVLADNTHWLVATAGNDTDNSDDSLIKKRQLVDETDRVCNKIEDLKKLIIVNYAGNPREVITNDGGIDLMKIKSKESRPFINDSYLADLKNEINSFRTLLQKDGKSESELYKYFDEVFNTYITSSDGEGQENMLLKDQILVSAIEKLNLMQFRARLAAYESISR